MRVGDDHAEVVFGAKIAHAVLDDRGELEFLQSGTRIIVQRRDAGIGDLRRAPQPLEFEVAFATCHVLDDVFGVDRSLPERFCDLIM